MIMVSTTKTSDRRTAHWIERRLARQDHGGGAADGHDRRQHGTGGHVQQVGLGTARPGDRPPARWRTPRRRAAAPPAGHARRRAPAVAGGRRRRARAAAAAGGPAGRALPRTARVRGAAPRPGWPDPGVCVGRPPSRVRGGTLEQAEDGEQQPRATPPHPSPAAASAATAASRRARAAGPAAHTAPGTPRRCSGTTHTTRWRDRLARVGAAIRLGQPDADEEGCWRPAISQPTADLGRHGRPAAPRARTRSAEGPVASRRSGHRPEPA